MTDPKELIERLRGLIAELRSVVRSDGVVLAGPSDRDNRAADAMADALASLSASVGVTVPCEPTDAMLEAAYNAMFEDRYDGTQAPMIGAAYDALIAASPARAYGAREMTDTTHHQPEKKS